MKTLLKFIPELYFMGLGIFWAAENYFSGGVNNYFALLIVWLMFLQLFYKNRILGLIYGTVFGLASAYMVLAVNSEVGDFSKFTIEALQLQLVGWGIFGTALLMAGAMVYRFATEKYDYDEESVLTVTY